jgi:hypothetical protein
VAPAPRSIAEVVSPDALLAQMRRVLDAFAPPQDAARLLERIELTFGGGHTGDGRVLLQAVLPYIEQAFPDDLARERLLEPLELALTERRYGDYGVLCARSPTPPRGWKGWRNNAAHVFEESYEGPERAWIAVRRGWAEPHFLVTRDAQSWNLFFDALIVPETHRLFVGVGTWLAVFPLDVPDEPLVHNVLLFWSMQREPHGILVVAEVSVRLFDLFGREQWDVFADPPHDVSVEGDEVVILEQLTNTTKRIRLRDGTLV